MSAILEAIERELPFLNAEQKNMLRVYYDMLVDWNTRINLTAITEENEAVQKHFADSLLPMGLIGQNASVIDVGTGAGFPGLVLAIARPDISMTLLDALLKRVGFLKAVCAELGLNIPCIHARGEDAGRSAEFRGRYDAAVSRAVARTGELIELTVPFLKVGGVSLMYKGPQAADELNEAQNALKALYARGKIVSFDAAWGERRVIVAQKLKDTPAQYPRLSAQMRKKPL